MPAPAAGNVGAGAESCSFVRDEERLEFRPAANLDSVKLPASPHVAQPLQRNAPEVTEQSQQVFASSEQPTNVAGHGGDVGGHRKRHASCAG
jgi:hypothetical protein